MKLTRHKPHLLRHPVDMHSQVDIHRTDNRHSAASCSASAPCATAQAPLVACHLYSRCRRQLCWLEQLHACATCAGRTEQPEVLHSDTIRVRILQHTVQAQCSHWSAMQSSCKPAMRGRQCISCPQYDLIPTC